MVSVFKFLIVFVKRSSLTYTCMLSGTRQMNVNITWLNVSIRDAKAT